MNLAEKFKDACGFGLLAQIKNRPSHALVEDAIRALSRMIHRGAVAADGKSGDGCGLLCAMPTRFMRRIAKESGHSLPEQFAVAMLFLTDEARQMQVLKKPAPVMTCSCCSYERCRSIPRRLENTP